MDPTKAAQPDNFISLERKIEGSFGCCEVRLERGGNCFSLESEERYQKLHSETFSDINQKSISLYRNVDMFFKMITVSKIYEPTQG